ncbi:vitamin K epoxide reductase family protein [Pirellulales bacterium]|nr:vitamin K epoxide reductase family protein [Pirellulales bacterium]
MLADVPQRNLRVTVQGVLLAAAGMSLWLAIQKWTGGIDTLAGCGTGSGCAQVLGSRWSMVIGVLPVSVFAIIVYLAASVSIWKTSPTWRQARIVLAAILIGAAVWFGALQVFVLSTVCRYCLTVHGLGIAAAIGLVAIDGAQWRELPSRVTRPMALGFGLAAWFAFIQVVGPIPETHRVETAPPPLARRSATSRRVIPANIHAAGSGRLVKFFDGQKSFRLGAVPLLGDPEARHVIVKYFDYTCQSCRAMHGQLEVLLERYPEEFAVIVIPAPLEKGCNSYLPATVQNHPDACGFARCALTMWRHAPGQFGDFHDWLFESHPTLEQAEERVGQEWLQDDETKRWVNAFLRQDFEDYGRLIQQTSVMPKLLVHGTKIMQGTPRDADALLETFRSALPED